MRRRGSDLAHISGPAETSAPIRHPDRLGIGRAAFDVTVSDRRHGHQWGLVRGPPRKRTPQPTVVTTRCRVASRNSVTGCLIKNVTSGQTRGIRSYVRRQAADLADKPLHGFLAPRPYSLLQRVKLSRAVLSRVANLELDEKLECGLIRLLFKTSSHLFPGVPKDIGTSTTRFVAEPTIRRGACCRRTAAGQASKRCFDWLKKRRSRRKGMQMTSKERTEGKTLNLRTVWMLILLLGAVGSGPSMQISQSLRRFRYAAARIRVARRNT